MGGDIIMGKFLWFVVKLPLVVLGELFMLFVWPLICLFAHSLLVQAALLIACAVGGAVFKAGQATGRPEDAGFAMIAGLAVGIAVLKGIDSRVEVWKRALSAPRPRRDRTEARRP
jgi:hypothetical protein